MASLNVLNSLDTPCAEYKHINIVRMWVCIGEVYYIIPSVGTCNYFYYYVRGARAAYDGQRRPRTDLLLTALENTKRIKWYF